MKRFLLFTCFVSSIVWASYVFAADADTPPRLFDAVFVKPLAPADVILLKKKDGTEQPVRLFGIACPIAPQPHAQQVATYLIKRLKDTPLAVEILTTDNTDLPVAWISMNDGSRLNDQLLQEGLAWWDESNAPDARKLKKYNAEALIAGKGLWRDPTPLAPWDYRASHNLPVVMYTVEPEPEIAQKPETAIEETPTLAAKGTMKPRPSMPTIPADYMGLVAKHQPRIAQDAQGNPLGLTASDISAIPGASLIGFRNGDIVRSVNGIAITNPAQLMGMYGKLKNAKQLDIQIIRDGGPITISIPL